MPVEETQEQTESNPKEEFLKIRNFDNEVVYSATEEELETILVSILMTGVYTKTFSIFGGKLEFTFKSITDDERNKTFDLMRTFGKANEDASQLTISSYTTKVNLASQLTRITVNGQVIPISQAALDERLEALSEQPEELIRSAAKYLLIFQNLTNKAFTSEDILKN